MTRRYFGTLYLVRPDWHGDPEDAHESVVESYPNGRSHLEVAMELWRVAGVEDRARRMEDVMDRAWERDRPVMDSTDIDEMLQELEGIEPALETSVIGPDWKLSPEQVDELRNKTKLLDLSDIPGHIPTNAMFEAISRVRAAQSILREARERGLHIALD